MIGLILCGGRSSRMGLDKGLIMQHNIPWARLAFNKLAELGLNVVLSVNKEQTKNYESFFALDHLVPDDEELQIGGPLKGLLSVHQRYPDENILLLACDMPMMDKIVLTNLMETAKKKNSRDAFVFESDGNREPLCAIYTATALQKVMELYQTNQLPKHSLKYVLEQLNTFEIYISDEWKPYFTNYNSPDELSTLKV
jgi:molybdopterin-guanine dinucleotide biosynthesis protein A